LKRRRRIRNVFYESDELLELGIDGHEKRCHKCKRFKDLLCCDGCPISLHNSCLHLMNLWILQLDGNGKYCLVCCEKKANDLANHVEKVTCCKPKCS
jgi:hypothetical protein